MPIPLIVGGALAGAGAITNWLGKREDAKRASAAYDQIADMSNQAMQANNESIGGYENLVNNTYGNGAAQYSTALQNFLNSPVYQNEGFTYNGDVSQFMDPAMNQRVDAAMNAINNSAASGGNRFSSDFISRVGARQQALASEEWEKAYNRLMQDRQMQLNEYNINSQNAWNNYNATNDRAKYGVDAYGRDRDAYVNGLGNVMSAQVQNRNANLNTQAQMLANSAQARQGTSGWDLAGGLLGAGSNFLGKYFGD